MPTLPNRFAARMITLLTCSLLATACGDSDHDLLDPWALSSAHYPQIASAILDTVRVETPYAHPHEDAFNPGMAEWRGETWMALRVDRFGSAARPGCEVERTAVMVQLDANYQVKSEYYPLELPHPGQRCSTAEDPRLLADGDHLYVIYNANSWLEDESSDILRSFFTELDMEHGAPRAMYTRQLESPDYPLRKWEKNWTPFITDTSVHLIYNSDPAVVFELPKDFLASLRASSANVGIVDLAAPTLSSVATPKPVGIYYGERRGGTQAIYEPQLDQYVTFSHSLVQVNKHGQQLYFAGFYTFKPTPPFDIVSYLALPLDIPNISPTINGFCKIVFPTGLTDLGDRYAVAFGEEDLAAGVSLIDKAKLFSELSYVD